jgi:hypothetical protein
LKIHFKLFLHKSFFSKIIYLLPSGVASSPFFPFLSFDGDFGFSPFLADGVLDFAMTTFPTFGPLAALSSLASFVSSSAFISANSASS